ncbi:MFS transporter [Streptomyces tritici]|uniref:MFS transporter n=1 Tax=Streptomyces tritici TaxID=2054410 RepID=UPI003AF00586
MYLATTGRRDAPPAPSGARRRVSRTVLALGAVSLVTDVSSEMVTAVLPLYLVVGLGLSPLQFGFLDGLFHGATALVRIAGGQFADRAGRAKTVAGFGYALSACSRLGLLLAGGAAAGIAAALAADRLGKGIRTAPRDALISLNSPPDGLGRAFGVHRAMDTTGALLGPLVAFALLWATADAYDAVFVVSFAVGLVGVLLLVAAVPADAPRPPRPRGNGRPRIEGSRAAGRGPFATGPAASRAFRRLLAATALLGAATVGDAFLYLLLQRRYDLAVTWFPLLPLGAAAVYLLLAVPAGRLADRFGRRRPFLYGHLALLAGYGLLLLAPEGGTGAAPVLVVALVLALLGVFYAATDGVLMALAGPLLHRERRAGGLAVVQTVQALARLVAATGFGAAWTLWGPGPALALALAALAAAALCASRLLPRTDTAPPDTPSQDSASPASPASPAPPPAVPSEGFSS